MERHTDMKQWGDLRCLACCLLACMLLLNGCAAETTAKPATTAAQEATKQGAVWELQCIQPTALSTIHAAVDGRIVVCSQDYENERTTLQLVDAEKDRICGEIALDGIWDMKKQMFSDGRIALCSRETNTWKFLSGDLKEIGAWQTEAMDGFFSFDASTYYCLIDHALFQLDPADGSAVRVALPAGMRIQELTAFQPESGILLIQCLLSPYSRECGTAVVDVRSGAWIMLQSTRYQASFCGADLFLLSFDREKMAHSVLYGIDGAFRFAAADVFSDRCSYLFSIDGSPFLMGIGTNASCLYAAGEQIASCALENWGIHGEMYTVCYLPDTGLLAGMVYSGGAFRLYSIDPSKLSFHRLADAVPADSPLTVDETLLQAYENSLSGTSVPESLQDARKYADALEETYGVRILLSSQCGGAAALCDHVVHLTDEMAVEDELNGILAMLDALEYSLSQYPKGFTAQFRNSMGDGGLCFLLVGEIETDYGAAGCTYERYEWQFIALDIRQTRKLDSVICHEIWHATENHIFSKDYTAFPIQEWEALNPPGFAYCMDAAKTDPNQKWTLYSSIPEEIYFVDSYACVDIKEDRARIMEYFMTCDEEARILIRSPRIRQKLQIMCNEIRQTFNTDGWEEIRWERLMQGPQP